MRLRVKKLMKMRLELATVVTLIKVRMRMKKKIIKRMGKKKMMPRWG